MTTAVKVVAKRLSLLENNEALLENTPAAAATATSQVDRGII